jgi:hypothetical protein
MRRRGGLTDDPFAVWRSAEANLDVRHRGTFSAAKVRMEEFKHRPTGWREVPVAETGWGEVCTALAEGTAQVAVAAGEVLAGAGLD